MGFIAEYSLSNPILLETRRTVPDVGVSVEDEQFVSDDRSRLILWAKGREDDLERFFRALPDDPSIAGFEVLSRLAGLRLFRVTLSEEGERGLTYVSAIDYGITLLDITAEGGTETDKVNYRAQMPHREAFLNYREECQERDLSFGLHRLYRSEDDATEGYGVTPRQAEVLRRALERGYYQVPREVSTKELAEEFDISSQALSALLRRGHAALLQNTVASGDGI